MSNLPPIEPRDLRNRDQGQSGKRSDYPPANQYPPPGLDAPHPQQPPARQGGGGSGQASSYPPADYPPPQRDEPRPEQPAPQRDNYPPSGAEQPRRPSQDSPRLDGMDAPDLRRRISLDDLADYEDAPPDVDPAQRLRRRHQRQILLSERQVEALGWGVTVILLGIAILLFFTTSSDFLTIGFPILGGGILLGTSIYQRMHGWDVSILTWTTAIGLVAFSLTRLIALLDGRETGVGASLAYFLGISIIITGVIVLIRIFGQPH